MRTISQTLNFLIYFAFGYMIFLENKRQSGRGATCGHTIGFITSRSFKCSPYLWTNTADAQMKTEKKRQSNTHAYAMQYKKVKLVACHV
jgi:hypothetical protein